jgi:hypothetical protein
MSAGSAASIDFDRSKMTSFLFPAAAAAAAAAAANISSHHQVSFKAVLTSNAN